MTTFFVRGLARHIGVRKGLDSCNVVLLIERDLLRCLVLRVPYSAVRKVILDDLELAKFRLNLFEDLLLVVN